MWPRPLVTGARRTYHEGDGARSVRMARGACEGRGMSGKGLRRLAYVLLVTLILYVTIAGGR